MEEKNTEKKENSFVCPLCGGKKLIRCVQNNYADVYPADKVFTFKSQPLYHEICASCGTVVRSFVKNPEKLM